MYEIFRLEWRVKSDTAGTWYHSATYANQTEAVRALVKRENAEDHLNFRIVKERRGIVDAEDTKAVIEVPKGRTYEPNGTKGVTWFNEDHYGLGEDNLPPEIFSRLRGKPDTHRGHGYWCDYPTREEAMADLEQALQRKETPKAG